MTQISTIVLLTYWLEDVWVGLASAAIFILIVACARFLVRIARKVSGRQIRDISAEEPWRPGEDFHIDIRKDDEQTDNKPKK